MSQQKSNQKETVNHGSNILRNEAYSTNAESICLFSIRSTQYKMKSGGRFRKRNFKNPKWKFYKVILKGSPNQIHLIFEINLGKSRIRPRTTLDFQ